MASLETGKTCGSVRTEQAQAMSRSMESLSVLVFTSAPDLRMPKLFGQTLPHKFRVPIVRV